MKIVQNYAKFFFTAVARTVEVHQPIIETYYGPGRLTTVMNLLQVECDKQSSKIFNEFRTKRGIAEKVSQIRHFIYGSGTSNLEARELGQILEEMAVLQARSEMYFKFVKKKCASEDATKIQRQILTCGLSQSVQELMSEYILFEEYYMTQNIRKAVQQVRKNSRKFNFLKFNSSSLRHQCISTPRK